MHIYMQVRTQDQLFQIHGGRVRIRTHSPSHGQVTSNAQHVTFSSISGISSQDTGHMKIKLLVHARMQYQVFSQVRSSAIKYTFAYEMSNQV